MIARAFRWVIGALIIALIGVYLSAFIVRQGEVVVVTRFGRIRRTLSQPGWYAKMFWPVDKAHRLDGRRRLFSPTFIESLTRDQQNLIIWSYAVWSIDEKAPETFVKRFKATQVGTEEAVRAAESQLNDLILNAQNARLAAYDLSQVVSVDPRTRMLTELEKDVTEMVRDEALKRGIRLHQYGVKRLAFPESTVKEALIQMRVKRNEVANRYRGEGAEKARIINANTRLTVAKIVADAKRRSAEIRGRAQAERARILQAAHGEDPEFYAWLRSLDALRETFGRRSTVILDTKSPPLEVLKQPLGPDRAKGVIRPAPAGGGS